MNPVSSLRGASATRQSMQFEVMDCRATLAMTNTNYLHGDGLRPRDDES